MTLRLISPDLTPAELGFLKEGWSVTDAWTALCWLRDQRPDWFAEVADVVEVSR